MANPYFIREENVLQTLRYLPERYRKKIPKETIKEILIVRFKYHELNPLLDDYDPNLSKTSSFIQRELDRSGIEMSMRTIRLVLQAYEESENDA